ncbi:acetyltransferase [Streptomyces lincolnensis]|uniref:Mycothiol acetyltransferase n=1 Tax=Streptomyces lincolnensis TaxID=1915 RepID=A0A1B1MC53_STRLN|nr:mycothiol synthase [Streptomyces lincolnensis]ANS66199.1 acetyltransferase [Streptomyces lincolnensis]AXG55072.1 acetyltransferase [Streptomyces lincolnensis]QMV08413.1 mycothiol synthase [Streptomyces lincolnensis]
MTSDDTARPAISRSIETHSALSPDRTEAVLGLLAEAADSDGQQAVSEQGRLQLRGGAREGVSHLLLYVGVELVGYAQLEDTDPVEAPAAELVVRPSHRGHGHGRALGSALLAASGKRLRVWAHGGHSAARHLAQVLGLTLFRELRQMRRPLTDLDLPDPVLPEGVSVRGFVPGTDEDAWIAVNAAAFAHHPEQGSLGRRDLDDRMAEPWFDPAGFFLAFRGEDLIGFHWTKVHAEERLGEVYVVGVRPGAQGGGLGKALTTIGLRHLAAQGLPTAMLYVDADNKAAVSVYERLGFTTYETDLMYRTET